MLTLLQLELLNTGLIRGDGGALDTNTILLDGLCGINCDLVFGLVTVLKTLTGSVAERCETVLGAYQVVVLEVDVKETSLSARRNEAEAFYTYGRINYIKAISALIRLEVMNGGSASNNLPFL